MMLKIGELATRTGLTVRTLHHYDAIGLLVPSCRSEGGYRLYNSADVRRLYQVLALARIGVPLGRIGAMIDGGESELGAVIDQQIAALDSRIAQALALRERLLMLRGQFESDDEAALGECLRTLELMTIYDRYFSPEEIATLRERRLAYGADADAADAEWRSLLAEVRAQMARQADPASEAVQQLAQRWQALVRQFTGGDPQIEAKVGQMYRNEDSVREHVGIDKEVFAFMRRAIKGEQA